MIFLLNTAAPRPLGATARASDRGMVGWRERLVVLLTVPTRSFSLSRAWMSQEQQLQQWQRTHTEIRGGARGTETSEGLVGVSVGTGASRLDQAHRGSKAGRIAAAGATEPSERVGGLVILAEIYLLCLQPSGCSNCRRVQLVISFHHPTHGAGPAARFGCAWFISAVLCAVPALVYYTVRTCCPGASTSSVWL